MFKHTQTIRRLLLTNCLSVLNHFVGLALKGLKSAEKTSAVKTLTFSKFALLPSHDCALFKVTFLLLSLTDFLLTAATLDVKALLVGKGGNLTFAVPVLPGLSRLVVKKSHELHLTLLQ